MFVARKNEKTLGHKHCLCYVSISISNLTKSTQVRRNCAEKAGPTLSHIDQMKPVHRTAWAMERRLKGRREEVVRKGLKHPETQAHCTVSVHLEAQRQHKPKATAAAIFSQPLKVTLIKCISSELEFKITLEVWKPEQIWIHRTYTKHQSYYIYSVPEALQLFHYNFSFYPVLLASPHFYLSLCWTSSLAPFLDLTNCLLTNI